MTDAEKKLWQALRFRQLQGVKFRRQAPIGRYIVDFACLESRLIIEVDGGQHNDCLDDTYRDAWLTAHGIKILRFWNNEVLVNLESVLLSIDDALRFPPPSRPSPVKGEGGASLMP